MNSLRSQALLLLLFAQPERGDVARAASEAPAGSPQSAGPVVGWRGDGTGKYPEAVPPTRWGRVSRAIQGLRYQASSPNDSNAGAPMPDGVIREWLILSPAPKGSQVDQEILPNEAQLAPEENGKIGDSVWKKVALPTSWLDFNQILDKPGRGIACAATNVYSDAGGKFRINATQLGGFRVVINGKQLPAGYGRIPIDLAKGWNRLLIKVAPRDSEWACTVTLHSRAPADYADTGLAWRVPLPGVTGGYYGGGTGCSSPIIVHDRIYLLSEPHDLICLDKAEGRVLWVRTNSYLDAATPEDRKHPACAEAEGIARKLNDLHETLSTGPLDARRLEEKAALEKALYLKMQEVDPVRYKKSETPDVGFSGMTPVSDGKQLYLWLATGVTACYDLEGRRKWIRVDNLPAPEHGFSSSPVLVAGKLIVFMRDVLAFEADTGALAWRIPLISHEGANPGGYFHGTPARVEQGGVPLIVLGNGTIVRAADGKILFTHPEMGNQAISSPVVERDLLFETSTGSMRLFIHQLPGSAAEPFKPTMRTVSVRTPDFPHYYMPWHMASPLIHEGLAYLMNNAGVLTVVDVIEGRVLYQKMIDLDPFQTNNEGAARGVGISPTLAGRYVYLFGNGGAAVVLEPGRIFKQVAKNKIENQVCVGHWGERQERFVSNPIFEGERLYIRGEGNLYAIGPEQGPGRTSRGELPDGPSAVAKPPASASPAPAQGIPPEPTPAEEGPASHFGWRRNGSGIYPGTTPPVEWSEKRNIKWRTPVGRGSASPIVTADRVIVLAEPAVLLCLRRTDGTVTWKAEVGSDLPADLLEKVRELPTIKEKARGTPVTDGRRIYVILGGGIVASYTLEGKRRWVQFVEPAALTYGPAASPLLVGETLVVQSKVLKALDADTGRILWSAPGAEPHYGTPAVITVGGIPFVVTPKGAVVRVSDGAVLAKGIAEGLGGDQAPSPVVRGDVVYFAYARSSAVKLALKDGRILHEKLWEQELPGDVIASPVVTDGLLYMIPAGSSELRVLSAKTGEILLQKDVDLSPNLYPSLALAGGRVFLGNDLGETLVLEPGREYKELRRNRLPEGSGSSPVFAGPNLFRRDGELLYCIGP